MSQGRASGPPPTSEAAAPWSPWTPRLCLSALSRQTVAESPERPLHGHRLCSCLMRTLASTWGSQAADSDASWVSRWANIDKAEGECWWHHYGKAAHRCLERAFFFPPRIYPAFFGREPKFFCRSHLAPFGSVWLDRTSKVLCPHLAKARPGISELALETPKGGSSRQDPPWPPSSPLVKPGSSLPSLLGTPINPILR